MMTNEAKLTDRQTKIVEAVTAARARNGQDEVFQANIVMGSGQRRPSVRELKAIAAKVEGLEYTSRSYHTEVGFGLFGRQGTRRALVVEAGLRFIG